MATCSAMKTLIYLWLLLSSLSNTQLPWRSCLWQWGSDPTAGIVGLDKGVSTTNNWFRRMCRLRTKCSWQLMSWTGSRRNLLWQLAQRARWTGFKSKYSDNSVWHLTFSGLSAPGWSSIYNRAFTCLMHCWVPCTYNRAGQTAGTWHMSAEFKIKYLIWLGPLGGRMRGKNLAS